MKCSNCNHENPNNSVFCTNCGGKLAEMVSPIMDNGAGTAVEEEVKPKMVKKQKEPKVKKEAKVKQEGEGKKKSKLKFIIPILLILVIVGGFGVYSFLNSPERLALKAAELVEVEKYEEAIEIYNKILGKDSKNSDTYLELAKIYNIMGEAGLEKDILEEGVREVEYNIPLKLALGKYFVDQDLYEEGEEIFLDIIGKSKKNLVAYESLMEIYDSTHDNDSIISLYNQYGNDIESDKATILVASGYFNIGEVGQANNLFASVNVDGIKDSNTLEKVAHYYIRINDRDKAISIANKGLESENPSAFHGILFGLKNDKGLKLIDLKSEDVTGDGKKENILLMAERDSSSMSEIIEIFIQDGSTGKIIETISLSDYPGHPGIIELGDLNHDGVLDLMVGVFGGGSSGLGKDYAYSFKDRKKVDLFDKFTYSVDIKATDEFKIIVYAEDIEKAIELELPEHMIERYIEGGYYTSSGLVSGKMYGYFKGDDLDLFYIEEINQYGLKQKTELTGPDSGMDYMAGVETIYLMKDGKWTTYDLKVEVDQGEVKLIDYAKVKEESILQKDLKRLEEIFAMTVTDLYRKYGAPIEEGWFMENEALYYEDMMYSVYEGEVVGIVLNQGDEIFGIKAGSKISEIESILGKADYDEYNDNSIFESELATGRYVSYFDIKGYMLLFYSPTMDGEVRIEINKANYW